MCGGTLLLVYAVAVSGGLSPRVRGNPALWAASALWTGSIPACAGEPRAVPFAGRGRQVYPRVCGGTWDRLFRRLLLEGLSPRVRGNPGLRLHRPMPARSIPACAGEPFTKMKPATPFAVYPRVCGGTGTAHVHARMMQGLSPRVRGNPTAAVLAILTIRSIPACAGEPASICPPTARCAVYPRVCGGTYDSPVSYP